MFQLNLEEGLTTENRGRHSKYAPYVFTELGVSMLSSVLGSERAILANITIMRAFVQMREAIHNQDQFGQRLDQLEWRQSEQN